MTKFLVVIIELSKTGNSKESDAINNSHEIKSKSNVMPGWYVRENDIMN